MVPIDSPGKGGYDLVLSYQIKGKKTTMGCQTDVPPLLRRKIKFNFAFGFGILTNTYRDILVIDFKIRIPKIA